MNFMTAAQAAELWGVTTRRVQAMCETGRLAAARRLGYMWVIPKGTPRPLDRRTKAAKARKEAPKGERGERERNGCF